MLPSRTISISIDRSPQDVYEFVRTPTNLPLWASGLGGTVEEVSGEWVIALPSGPATVRFCPANEYGVLDHDVTTSDGVVTHNPMRAIANGPGCELLFSLFQRLDIPDREFSRDVSWVKRDFETLRDVLEG